MSRARRREGFALPAVPWGTMLLALVAGNLLLIGRAGREQAIAAEIRARLLAATEAGIERALHDLERIRPGTLPERIDLVIDGISVEVRIASESGRIDLDRAPPSLLAAAFEHAGAGPDAAARLAAAALDWRDVDQVETLGGAENRSYRLIGRPDHPRDGPFASVGEIVRLRGADMLDPDLLHDMFTVASPTAMVELTVAGEAVRAALEGASDASPDKQAPAGLGLLAQTQIPGTVLRLQIVARDAGSGIARLDLLVRLTGRTGRPFEKVFGHGHASRPDT